MWHLIEKAGKEKLNQQPGLTQNQCLGCITKYMPDCSGFVLEEVREK